MRLSQFIRENMEVILQEWQDFATTLHPLQESSKVQLRDHAQEMLRVICVDLDTFQADAASVEKSHGHGPEVDGDTAAQAHAADRLESGFSIEELMAEYRAVRASVLRLWQVRVKSADEYEVQDMVRFNEAIDQSLTESIARYSSMLRDTQNVFLAILGHDVRNPLGAISMGAQLLLQDETMDPNQHKLASRILGSTQRVNEIVSDLLDFSTSHLGGGIPVRAEGVDFRPECQAVVDEIRTFYPQRRIELEMTGDLEVNWDRARIGQALSNLIANAVQHGRTGAPVWVSVSGKHDIEWVIQNEGDVIDPVRMRTMFDPIKQFVIKSAIERSSAQTNNLGLGLYITREIVSAHGGHVTVASSADEGTTFTVHLPRTLAPAAAAPASQPGDGATS